jgi:hypothetical protein
MRSFVWQLPFSGLLLSNHSAADRISTEISFIGCAVNPPALAVVIHRAVAAAQV